MRAAVVRPSGALGVIEVPEPEPGPGQVLVEAEVIGAGYVDVMLSRGEYRGIPGPGSVPGVEVVGRVRAAGPGAPGDLVGRRVLAMPGFGGYAERVVVDADRVLPVEREADAAEAVGLGVNALVAETALYRAGVAAGEQVLVRGAGGGIGSLATQLASARGAEVTAVTSSAARGERLLELGASRIVDRTGSAVPDRTYDVIVDTVAGPDTGRYLRLLRDNGRHVMCGGVAGAPDEDLLAALLGDFHKSPTLLALSLNSLTPRELLRSWQEITALWTKGSLSPVLYRRLALTDAQQALELLERGTPFGKVVLVPR
ncbi:quinone oxidoreductase family protein [Streptomyces javensis]|uniref:Zinc-binding dehydrogenase n=1 Tax=Streptomyces javensis TaxID=114698 RepID=A0ABS0RC51_9ACTN|nr:zinc-binding dehydrogenase [Streptomyces javensis]MBI0314959.1 zinc-binding dehydrogenase [Streptomyces javensis]